MGRYDYDILKARAERFDASEEDLKNLGDWFREYGMMFWNGECFDVEGRGLFPVFSEPDEDGDSFIVGYELR